MMSNFTFGHNVSNLIEQFKNLSWRFFRFFHNVFKVVCCRFVVCGKGVNEIIVIDQNCKHFGPWFSKADCMWRRAEVNYKDQASVPKSEVQISWSIQLFFPQYLFYHPRNPYAVGTQKNRLIETILLSTPHIIGLERKIRVLCKKVLKVICFYERTNLYET